MRFSTFTTARVDLPLPHASLSKEADKQGSDRGSRRCCYQTSTAGALLCIHVDFRTSSRNPGNCQEDYSRYCYLCHSSRAAGRERPGRHRGTSGRRGPSATGLTLWEEHMRCAVMVMISESCRWIEGLDLRPRVWPDNALFSVAKRVYCYGGAVRCIPHGPSAMFVIGR